MAVEEHAPRGQARSAGLSIEAEASGYLEEPSQILLTVVCCVLRARFLAESGPGSVILLLKCIWDSGGWPTLTDFIGCGRPVLASLGRDRAAELQLRGLHVPPPRVATQSSSI